jgi:hypothetical protein
VIAGINQKPHPNRVGLFAVGMPLMVELRGDLGAAQYPGQPSFHLVLREEPLRLCLARFVEVRIAVQHKQGRLHQKLSGRLAGVQGDQFKLRELFKIEIDVHSIKVIFQ